MSTKDRILETALRLFNESGTAAVSTNHVAGALDISPGNLYYHFKNKDDLVCALFERMSARLDEAWEVDADRLGHTSQLGQVVKNHLGVLNEYRFLARELLGLVASNAVLGEHYRKLVVQRAGELEALFKAMISSGAMRDPGGSKAIKGLAQAFWMVSTFSLAQALATSDSASEAPRRAAELVLRTLAPHLTESGAKGLTADGMVPR